MVKPPERPVREGPEPEAREFMAIEEDQPLYVQIRDALMRAIGSGELAGRQARRLGLPA